MFLKRLNERVRALIERVRGRFSKTATFADRFFSDRIPATAAALSFTTVLSFIPIVASAYAILEASNLLKEMWPLIVKFISNNMAPAFAQSLSEYLSSIRVKISPKKIGTFGLVGFVVTAVWTLSEIEAALNTIRGEQVQKKKKYRRYLVYVSLLIGGPLLIGASLWLSARAESPVLPYFFSTVLFFFMFRFFPAGRVDTKPALYAGALTGLSFELMKLIYAGYVERSLKVSVYGKLAVLPMFLLWVHITWIVVLCGFEFACYLQRRYRP